MGLILVSVSVFVFITPLMIIISDELELREFDNRPLDYWIQKGDTISEVQQFKHVYPNATASLSEKNKYEIEIAYGDYDKTSGIESIIYVMFSSDGNLIQTELHCSDSTFEDQIQLNSNLVAILSKISCEELLFPKYYFEELDEPRIITEPAVYELPKEISKLDYLKKSISHPYTQKFLEMFPYSWMNIETPNNHQTYIEYSYSMDEEFDIILSIMYEFGFFDPFEIDFACNVPSENYLFGDSIKDFSKLVDFKDNLQICKDNLGDLDIEIREIHIIDYLD